MGDFAVTKKRIAHSAKFPNDIIKVALHIPNLNRTLDESVKKRKKKKTDNFINDDDEENTDFMKLSKSKIVLSGTVKNESILNGKQCFSLIGEHQVNPYSGRLRKVVPECLNEGKLFLKQIEEAYQQVETQPIKRDNKRNIGSKVEDKVGSSVEDENQPPVTYLRPSGRNLDWDNFIELKENPNILENLSRIPPVDYFRGVPFVNIWKDTAVVGLYIELRNPFARVDRDVFWIASIVHYAGYRALVKFETFSNIPEPSYVTWISFCSNVPKPLGWCSKNGKELFPGPIVVKHNIAHLQEKLRNFYESRPPTIKDDHLVTLIKNISSMKTLDHSRPIECLNVKGLLREYRVARISMIIGDRIHVQFHNDEGHLDDTAGFWFSYKSESVHPFGWSHSVGVKLNGNPKGNQRSPLPPESFPSWPSDLIVISKGMRLEVRNPIQPNRIVGAIIVKVLNHGYFVVQTRDVDSRFRVEFIFHVTSRFIYPTGFGTKHKFHVEYVESSRHPASSNLRLDLLPPRPPHSFLEGQKIEAIDVLDPRFAGPATIKKVAGHMLLIHFDHWNTSIESNYFWMDAFASDIYPLGYSELVGLEYQGSV